MMLLRYQLVIEVPGDLDDELLQEIEDSADPKDTTPKLKISRFIGGCIDDAENALNLALPEHWWARIGEAS